MRGNFKLGGVIIAAAILLAAISIVPLTSSYTTNDTVIINVTIQPFAEITVVPISLTWVQNPGTDGEVYNLTMWNTGSVNLSQIYAYPNTTEVESSNPIPAGVSSQYASGGFIFIKNETNLAWWHMGRQEWNMSQVLSGEILNLSSDTTKYGHGWYKNVSAPPSGEDSTYLWKIENGTDGYCNDTGAIFKIKKDPENRTTEQRDLTVNLAAETFESAGANWATWKFSDGPLAGHCLATYKDCDRIYIYKYDWYDTTNRFPSCTQRNYLRSNTLVPGESSKVWMFASVPEGTPAGETAITVVTFIATYT